MHILIVTPAKPGSRHGNRNTAVRWARLLREQGHTVVITVEYDARMQARPFDLLIALHARRSAVALATWKARSPRKPAILALTGTDLYRDIRDDATAQASLKLADRLIVLQDEGVKELSASLRKKTHVVYQSVDPIAHALPPVRSFLVTVIGHLREEKDPFRAAAALRYIDPEHKVRVVQLGGAMSPEYAAEASQRMSEDPRYAWLGEHSHSKTMRWLARSHVMVISSRMEGGAHVVSEAIDAGVPIIASKVSGNIGMLGRDYAGYYPLENERALAKLLTRCIEEEGFLGMLCAQVVARRPLIARTREAAALKAVISAIVGFNPA